VGDLGCFQSLVIVNSAAISMHVQVVLSYLRAHSFGYMSRSGIAGSYGSSVYTFFFHIAFHSGCTNLHSHQQHRSVPFPSHPRQHLLFCVLLTIAILTRVRQNLNVVLICISFMAQILRISSFIYWPFIILLLRIVCSVHMPICSMGCWLFKWLVFFELLVYSGY
jgi:hypothetical protein